MESKIEFKLRPVAGAVSSDGGFRAYVSTAEGDALGLDDVIAEARDHGYLPGLKDAAVRSVVVGILDSMIDGVMRDGRTRRIGEYLSVSLKVHGRFADAHDDFDPERHSLALSVKQLRAFRPSFSGVEAVNTDRRRQFRIYSVATADAADAGLRAGRLAIGREFVVKGADFGPESPFFGVGMSLQADGGKLLSGEPRVLSATDGEIRCAWPPELSDSRFVGARGEVTVFRRERADDASSHASRAAKFVVVPSPPEK